MVKLEKIKTVEAYLAFERASFEKNEFLSFQILTRPTKNRIQNLIGGNLFALI
jgi:hypothetical protein